MVARQTRHEESGFAAEDSGRHAVQGSFRGRYRQANVVELGQKLVEEADVIERQGFKDRQNPVCNITIRVELNAIVGVFDTSRYDFT